MRIYTTQRYKLSNSKELDIQKHTGKELMNVLAEKDLWKMVVKGDKIPKAKENCDRQITWWETVYRGWLCKQTHRQSYWANTGTLWDSRITPTTPSRIVKKLHEWFYHHRIGNQSSWPDWCDSYEGVMDKQRRREVFCEKTQLLLSAATTTIMYSDG